MFTRVRIWLIDWEKNILYYAFDLLNKFLFFVAGQVQVTNAFDSSTVEINPPGFDVQDYLQVYV